MARQDAKNNTFLKGSKAITSPPVYSLILELTNNGREDLADTVMKIDYLLEYTSTCIKQRDIKEARETLKKAKDRIDILKNEGVDTEYLDYLYEGIAKKCKITIK